MRRLALLLAVLAIAAAAPRLKVRFQPPVGSAWTTTGTLTVVTRGTGPDGQSHEEKNTRPIAWTERIMGGSSLAGYTKELSVGTSKSVAHISPRARQQVSEFDGKPVGDLAQMFNQPALFPINTVTVGDTWEIPPEQGPSYVAGEHYGLPGTLKTQGTGKLLAADDKTARLELSLHSELDAVRPDQPFPHLVSSTETMWVMDVDLATGWATGHQVHSVSQLTLTLLREGKNETRQATEETDLTLTGKPE